MKKLLLTTALVAFASVVSAHDHETTGDTSHTGNSSQLGDSYQAGNSTLLGNQTTYGSTNTGALDVNGSATCLLYTSPSPRDRQKSRMPSSA